MRQECPFAGAPFNGRVTHVTWRLRNWSLSWNVPRALLWRGSSRLAPGGRRLRLRESGAGRPDFPATARAALGAGTRRQTAIGLNMFITGLGTAVPPQCY